MYCIPPHEILSVKIHSSRSTVQLKISKCEQTRTGLGRSEHCFFVAHTARADRDGAVKTFNIVLYNCDIIDNMILVSSTILLLY